VSSPPIRLEPAISPCAFPFGCAIASASVITLARLPSFARRSRSILRIRRRKQTSAESLKLVAIQAGAIAAFSATIEVQPDFEKAHYNLGIALRAQGKNLPLPKRNSDELSGACTSSAIGWRIENG